MLSSANLQSKNSEIAIRVSNLSKVYQVYERPGDRLKQSVLSRLQKRIGLAPRKYYREFWALKDISFEVKKGETVGIIGKNGSGKSTLLQTICGTLEPTQGKVEIKGRVAALLELGSGFNPEFTGKDNVYMYAAVMGLSETEIDNRLQNILDFAGIGDFISQPIKFYSSGMVVRLAFAVIVHVDVDVLIIDEALSVGDAFFVQKCMRFLRSFMKSGTVLFVSHDTSAVVNLCERVVWLDHGMVADVGTAKNMVERYLECLCNLQKVDTLKNTAICEEQTRTNQENYRDMRQDFINASSLRNDIEVFHFGDNSSDFGSGGAVIIRTNLADKKGNPLSWVIGGEEVKLVVGVKAIRNLYRYIIGFQVKDRLGQIIFADNTFITYMNSPLTLNASETACIAFSFVMPILPSGHYSISVAIAEGSQEEHVILQWVHDALMIKVHSSVVCHGLIQVPMLDITIN